MIYEGNGRFSCHSKTFHFFYDEVKFSECTEVIMQLHMDNEYIVGFSKNLHLEYNQSHAYQETRQLYQACRKVCVTKVNVALCLQLFFAPYFQQVKFPLGFVEVFFGLAPGSMNGEIQSIIIGLMVNP